MSEGQGAAITLPKPIEAYFAADRDNVDTVSGCFTEDAVVTDEGKTYHGRSAIQLWKSQASKKYAYTNEPFKCESDGETTVVTCHLVGNFPGSPIDLRFRFRTEGDKISSLVIRL